MWRSISETRMFMCSCWRMPITHKYIARWNRHHSAWFYCNIPLVLWHSTPRRRYHQMQHLLPPLHTLCARLLHSLVTMRQETGKKMKTTEQRYKGNHDGPICNAPQPLYTGQKVCTDLPLIASSVAGRMATKTITYICSLPFQFNFSKFTMQGELTAGIR